MGQLLRVVHYSEQSCWQPDVYENAKNQRHVVFVRQKCGVVVEPRYATYLVGIAITCPVATVISLKCTNHSSAVVERLKYFVHIIDFFQR